MAGDRYSELGPIFGQRTNRSGWLSAGLGHRSVTSLCWLPLSVVCIGEEVRLLECYPAASGSENVQSRLLGSLESA